MGYILSISMCMQNLITIFHSVQEIAPFSLFQNLALDKASTNDKCHFQFLELDLVNINVSAKFYQNIPNCLRVKFHCFQNLNLCKTSTNLICFIMSISICLQNFITIFHSVQTIGPFSPFSEFEARQSLDR